MGQRFSNVGPDLIFLRFVMPAALTEFLKRHFEINTNSKRDENDKGKAVFPTSINFVATAGLTRQLEDCGYRLTSGWTKTINNYDGLALILKYSRNGKAGDKVRKGVRELRGFLAGIWEHCQIYEKTKKSIHIVDLAARILDDRNVPVSRPLLFDGKNWFAKEIKN